MSSLVLAREFQPERRNADLLTGAWRRLSKEKGQKGGKGRRRAARSLPSALPRQSQRVMLAVDDQPPGRPRSPAPPWEMGPS